MNHTANPHHVEPKIMSKIMVSCTVPEKLVGVIDKHVGRTLDSRAQWIRAAIYAKAREDGLLRREATQAEALEIDRILG